MGGDPGRPGSGLDRGLKRLMILVGVLLVATPLLELAVQLAHGERPQILLFGGFCLIGILTVSYATRGDRSSRNPPCGAPPAAPPGESRERRSAGDALWLP
jgi:hypothetical protein